MLSQGPRCKRAPARSWSLRELHPSGPAPRWPPIPRASKGRLHPEPPSRTRNAFARDRDRIIHSTAFRRLKEQDPGLRRPRGRLLPHPAHPFAGGGPDRPLAGPCAGPATRISPRPWRWPTTSAIRPSATPARTSCDRCMAPWGGFDHNVQTFRVCTELEARYPAFPGLNLDLGDAGGGGQAQRPGARPAGASRRGAGGGNSTQAGPGARRPGPRPRRRSRRSPTTSPTTTTTWTTGCRRGCSPSPS